jgi:hypothetical protein
VAITDRGTPDRPATQKRRFAGQPIRAEFGERDSSYGDRFKTSMWSRYAPSGEPGLDSQADTKAPVTVATGKDPANPG